LKFLKEKTVIGCLLPIFFLQLSLHAQPISPDIKIHDIGKVRRTVTNSSYALDRYSGIQCEYPIGSLMEHVNRGWPKLELVAIPPKNDSLNFLYTSFFAPMDTIWVIEGNKIVDLPFWKGYKGRADQDFVYRLRNDSVLNSTLTCNSTGQRIDVRRSPLYLEINVQSLAWNYPPMNEVLLSRYYVMPKKIDLKGVYLSLNFSGGIGDWNSNRSGSEDDYSIYYKDEHMAIVLDGPEGPEGLAKSCIGYRVFPPHNISPDALRWTTRDDFSRSAALACIQSEREFTTTMYGLLSSGVEFARGEVFGSGWIAVGPFNVAVGDTLSFDIAEILGTNIDDIFRKSVLLDRLSMRGFGTPVPPPSPPVRVERGNKSITLKWDPLSGENNPETYTDPSRADDVKTPFEGYRVYRSVSSILGPWTIAVEYDIAGDGYGHDFGLQREYTETLLLNNFEYYYTVTAFSKEDRVTGMPSRESKKEAAAVRAIPGTPLALRVGEVAVVPNPYRGDVYYQQYYPPWERPTGKWTSWFENDRRIQFISLPERCEIKIFTVSGDWITTLYHNDAAMGHQDWNLTSYVGQAISSGLYLFSVEDKKNGGIQVGKFVIIK
jgi:hypothetical protein